MSIEVKGTLVNLEIRLSGTANAFKKLVCLESSTFTINSQIAKRRTNCGFKATAADPEFSASVDAVQNANPGATEANYQDIKSFIVNKQKVDFRYASWADTGAGLGFGDGIYNFGSGYFSELSDAASAQPDGLLTYSVKLEGVGVLDVFDTSS